MSRNQGVWVHWNVRSQSRMSWGIPEWKLALDVFWKNSSIFPKCPLVWKNSSYFFKMSVVLKKILLIFSKSWFVMKKKFFLFFPHGFVIVLKVCYCFESTGMYVCVSVVFGGVVSAGSQLRWVWERKVCASAGSGWQRLAGKSIISRSGCDILKSLLRFFLTFVSLFRVANCSKTGNSEILHRI